MRRKRRPTQQIQAKIGGIEERLAAARDYVGRGINVEGSAFLHLSDWNGHSGHPLWVQNYMIPVLLRSRTRQEKKLRALENRAKDRRISERKQPGRRG